MKFGHQHDGSIGADREKSRMTERNLPGIAHQKVQADNHDNIDGHVVGYVYIVVFNQEWECNQENQQGTEPEKDDAGTEQLNILVIIPLHVHRWWSFPVHVLMGEYGRPKLSNPAKMSIAKTVDAMDQVVAGLQVVKQPQGHGI